MRSTQNYLHKISCFDLAKKNYDYYEIFLYMVGEDVCDIFYREELVLDWLQNLIVRFF